MIHDESEGVHDACAREIEQMAQDARDFRRERDHYRATLELLDAKLPVGPLLDIVREALGDSRCGDVATSPPTVACTCCQYTITKLNEEVAQMRKTIATIRGGFEFISKAVETVCEKYGAQG